ncbi:MAG: helix-turn-helix domain-containing protein [Pirellulales bacterium]
MILFDDAVLRPLIERVVGTVLDRLESQREAVGERIAYSEAEAASLLGVQRHVLRDARLRGELFGCRVGKRICYEREELLRFLRSRRDL